MSKSVQHHTDNSPSKGILKYQLPYALVVAQRLRKQAKALILDAEALEGHYRQDVKPMRDQVFRHSKKNR